MVETLLSIVGPTAALMVAISTSPRTIIPTTIMPVETSSSAKDLSPSMSDLEEGFIMGLIEGKY